MASGTPYAQVRTPVGDLVSPPTYASRYYLGKKLSGGGKYNRRRKNYAAAEKLSGGGRGWAKNSKNLTVPTIVAQYQKLHFPYPLQHILCQKSNAIAYTLPKLCLSLIHCRLIVIH